MLTAIMDILNDQSEFNQFPQNYLIMYKVM
jgi:hypothetical protein